MSISGVTSNNYWYNVDQTWSQSRQAISQQFLNESLTLNSALSDTMSNQITGMATLAAQAALARIQRATGTASGKTSSTPTTATSTVATSATGTSTGASKSSGAGSQYAYTSAVSILSNSNIVSFFA